MLQCVVKDLLKVIVLLEAEKGREHTQQYPRSRREGELEHQPDWRLDTAPLSHSLTPFLDHLVRPYSGMCCQHLCPDISRRLAFRVHEGTICCTCGD